MTERTYETAPEVWPVCVTPDKKTGNPCNAPMILRRTLTWHDGFKWMWFCDCKHKVGQKGFATEVHNEAGRMGPLDEK